MKRKYVVFVSASLATAVIIAGLAVGHAARAADRPPAASDAESPGQVVTFDPNLQTEKIVDPATDAEAQVVEWKLGALETFPDSSYGITALGQAGGSVASCAQSYCRSPKAACYVASFAEVEWQFCAVDKVKRGLWIENVKLKGPNKPLTEILYEAGPMEIFVPYHDGSPRGYDMQYCDDTIPCQRALPGSPAQWAGPTGFITNLTPTSDVVVETRETGLSQLCTGPLGTHVRRGSEVVVWALHDPGNYDNIIQYSFRDDGSLGLRAGVTGYNNQSEPETGHMHNVLWRIDMDLNGPGQDTPYLKRHFESGVTANDTEVLFNSGREGSAYWDATRFTSLLVEDAALNVHKAHMGYELVPVRTGTARHYGPDENWTRRDFLVTRYSNQELEIGASNLPFQFWRSPSPDSYLMDYPMGISNLESVVGTDNVIWHVSSAHHDPHDEDRRKDDADDQITGITQTHWSGADLVPHNFFDYNPLGDGPKKCGN